MMAGKVRDEIRSLLRSPSSGSPLVDAKEGLATVDGDERYPIVNGMPILVVWDRSIVGETVLANSAASEIVRRERSGLACKVDDLAGHSARSL